MSNFNPMIGVAAPMADGPGWCVVRGQQGTALYVQRDDGVTVIGCYMNRDAANKNVIVTRLLATAGITANEIARVNAAAVDARW
jgi:hypothetical protein